VSLAARVPFSSNVMRAKVVAALEDQLDSSVELERLSVRLYPRLHADGHGLTIHHKGRTDVPPLIRIEQFDIDTDLVGMWRHRVAHVKLAGLVISIPPHEQDEDNARAVSMEASSAERRAGGDEPGYATQIVIDELEAPEAQLKILRREPDKGPRVWYLH